MIIILTEHAKKREDFRQELQDKQYQIQDNLVRIYTWRDSDLKNHWSKELYSLLPRVPRLKNNNKYPGQKFIYKYIYGEMEDVINNDTLEAEVLSDADIENKDIPLISLDNLKKFIEEYCLWLSEILSQKGFVSTRDVSKEVDLLLDKYKF